MAIKYGVRTYWLQNICECGGHQMKGSVTTIAGAVRQEHVCQNCGKKEFILIEESTGVRFNIDYENILNKEEVMAQKQLTVLTLEQVEEMNKLMELYPEINRGILIEFVCKITGGE